MPIREVLPPSGCMKGRSRCSGTTRRDLLLGSAALAAVITAPGWPARAQQMKPAIDTHAHIFKRGLKLADVRRYAPDYDATLTDYLTTLDANGMTHGVLVQPS